MSKYKKLNDVITINQDNSEQINITLSYQDSSLYFGLEDQDENYEGNLKQTRYDISSNYDGCSAYTINEQGSTEGTALLIVCNITKNDSQSSRIITYTYKNTPLFKINQTANIEYINELYMYAVELSGYASNYFIFNECQRDFISLVSEADITYPLKSLYPGMPDLDALICISCNSYSEDVIINGMNLANATNLGEIISKVPDDNRIEIYNQYTIVYGENYNIHYDDNTSDRSFEQYSIYKVRGETTRTPYNTTISLFYCDNIEHENSQIGSYYLYEHIATWYPSIDNTIPYFYFIS